MPSISGRDLLRIAGSFLALGFAAVVFTGFSGRLQTQVTRLLK